MTTQPEIVRQSDLLNELVLDRNTMEEIGRVEVLWMYPQAHRVLGFICKSGLLGNHKYAFQLAQIDALGDSGVITHAQPEKTAAEKVRQLESLIGLEIWSDEGNRIGKIIDCLFHLHTGEITHYLFVSSGWSSLVGEVYQLPPNYIQSFGRRRVLVSEAAAAKFELYQAGISQKLTEVGETLKEEAVQEWTTFAKRAESTTEQARTRAQQLSQQFKQKAQTWLEQAKEKSQVLAERVKENTQAISEQIEERVEDLTFQSGGRGFDPADADLELEDFDLEADWFEESDPPSPSTSPNPSSPNTAPAPPLPHLTMSTLPAQSPAQSSVNQLLNEPLNQEPANQEPANQEPVNQEPVNRPSQPEFDLTPDDDDDDPWI